MNCRSSLRHIHAFLDDELEGSVQEALRAHLGECIACSARLDEERRIRGAIRAARPGVARSGVAQLGAGAQLRRPRALSAGLVLLRERRTGAEEAATMRLVKRVAAVAALVLATSGLLIGLQAFRAPGVEAAGTSMRNVTVSTIRPQAEDLIDEVNSIVLAFERG